MFISIESVALPLLCFLAVIATMATFRIVGEYQRAVVFTLGRFERVEGPGLVILIPFIQEVVRMDLGIQAIKKPSRDVIARTAFR